MSISMNMTPENDNKIIWVFEIETDDFTIYASYPRSITLSTGIGTREYRGDVLNSNQINSLITGNNILDGGGIGQVSTGGISILSNSKDPNISNFKNDLYPATGGAILYHRPVKVGIIWESATFITDITYLNTFVIESYTNDTWNLNMELIGVEEADISNIPYYKVQEDYDDGISYFPNADKLSLGEPLNIVYGNFTINDDKYVKDVSYAPCQLLKTTSGEVSLMYHPAVSGSNTMCKYVENIDAYIDLTSGAPSGVWDYQYSGVFWHSQSDTYQITGKVIIPFINVHSATDANVIDAEKAFNLDETTYAICPSNSSSTINPGIFATIGSTLADSDIGIIPTGIISDVQFGFRVRYEGLVDTVNPVWTMKVVNRNTSAHYEEHLDIVPSSSPTEYDMVLIINQDTDRQKLRTGDGTLHPPYLEPPRYTAEELSNFVFGIENHKDATGYDIRVYNGYLILENVNVNGFNLTQKPTAPHVKNRIWVI